MKNELMEGFWGCPNCLCRVRDKKDVCPYCGKKKPNNNGKGNNNSNEKKRGRKKNREKREKKKRRKSMEVTI